MVVLMGVSGSKTGGVRYVDLRRSECVARLPKSTHFKIKLGRRFERMLREQTIPPKNNQPRRHPDELGEFPGVTPSRPRERVTQHTLLTTTLTTTGDK